MGGVEVWGSVVGGVSCVVEGVVVCERGGGVWEW